jgi:ABC-type nickel/cobalt efflux system permease component RcnA
LFGAEIPPYVQAVTPRSKLVAASIFTFINLAGAPFALAEGEPLHAAVHVVLLFVGAYWIWRLLPRARQDQLPTGAHADAQLDQLQRAVDAIALDVERIGEAQRYIAKIAAEQAETPPRKPGP